jgi:hypothetical protein
MWLRLRQITVAAQDLRRTAVDLSTVLGLEACFTDPSVKAFGLKNTLFPIGSQFIEVVTPTREDTAGGRYMQRRGGDTGYLVIAQTDDVERRKARAAELGVRITLNLDLPAEHLTGVQLHPKDTGGALWEIDQMTLEGGDAPDGPWAPAGHNWRPYVRTDLVSSIVAAELQSADPGALAARWGDIAELDVGADAAGNPCIALDDAILRFVEATDGRGEGLGGIDVKVEDRDAVLIGARVRDCYVSDEQVDIGGLRVRLV